MYNPTAMAAQAHTHEMLQSQDARAQQSQQAPTQLLLNSTNAEQRWDGKSAILKYLEPIISTFKNVVSPITNVLYGAMPTVRGLSSDVSTAKNVETEPVEEVKKPKEFLVPQPRFIRAQRKNFRKTTTRPKKHSELKIDLDRLKHNKDLYDYIKTKKYKYNYPSTYYYPRVKYVINPNTFNTKPNNSRLIPYRKMQTTTSSTTTENYLSFVDSDWKPVLVLNSVVPQNDTKNETKKHDNLGKKAMRRFFRKKPHLKRRKRIKRDLTDIPNSKPFSVTENISEGRGFFDMFSFLFNDPMTNLINRANEYAKTYLKSNLKSRKEPPYYTTVYNILIMSVDLLDGLLGVGEEMHYHYLDIKPKKYKSKKNKKNKVKTAPIIEKENNTLVENTDFENSTTATADANHENTTKALDVVSTLETVDELKQDNTSPETV